MEKKRLSVEDLTMLNQRDLSLVVHGSSIEKAEMVVTITTRAGITISLVNQT